MPCTNTALFVLEIKGIAMNDAAIKNFCIWARNTLRQQVEQLLLKWDIVEDTNPFEAVVGGKPLSKGEQDQRSELIGIIKKMGREQLIETAAYTWFNRFIAMRYMEVNDLLPAHTRMFSEADGAFGSVAVKDALNLEIEGLDRQKILELVQAGNDEELFRYLFLAECNELADCLPDVFEHIGSAMELLLPQGLFRQGSVIERLVDDIPEDNWHHGVEIVGWMYQYYVSERKDEVFAGFKKGKKTEPDDIAPATQLFTPDWIVRYLTENSLGRLWMQAHPKSSLPDQMPYYIPDEKLAVDQEHVSLNPESITVIDPACGSGHILVYAFRLLAAMYEEAGYSRRDIPRLILKKNLTGCEIDPRAAQLAAFALAMTACEWDSRFLRRDEKVHANIVCLRSIEIAPLELGIAPTELEMMPYLADRAKLLDAMAHMEECGSLFIPEPEDIEALEKAAYELDGRMAGGDLLAYAPNNAVEIMLENCAPLAKTYDVVIANPPYMGSKNMNKWLSDWTKKNYPNSSRDLFSCFIERNLQFSKTYGELGFMTPYVWMFIGSYEKLRNKLINKTTITSLIQLEYSGFSGATVPICTFTLQKGRTPDYQGGYVRLSDFIGAANQAPKALEAIANPDCGWFYRRNSDSFKAIPGSPIAYWASDTVSKAFQNGTTLCKIGFPRQGLATGENARFVRQWWEPSQNRSRYDCDSIQTSIESKCRWFPYNKGGAYRKWFGNNDCVVNWENDGTEIREFVDAAGKQLSLPRNTSCYFLPSITWSKISSGSIAFRYKPQGHIFDVAGTSIFADEFQLKYLQGLCNSSVILDIASMLSPTLNFEVGQIATYPVFYSKENEPIINALVDKSRSLSKSDWDSFETSWDFKRHPMM